MKLIRGFLILLLSTQLISCGKSEKQLAAGKLKLAESLYEKGDTVKGKVVNRRMNYRNFSIFSGG